LIKCECDKQKVDEKVHDYIYELCSNCGGIIGRKAHICKSLLRSGYCKIAEMNNYSYPCRVNGEYTKCANGKSGKEKA